MPRRKNHKLPTDYYSWKPQGPQHEILHSEVPVQSGSQRPRSQQALKSVKEQESHSSHDPPKNCASVAADEHDPNHDLRVKDPKEQQHHRPQPETSVERIVEEERLKEEEKMQAALNRDVDRLSPSKAPRPQSEKAASPASLEDQNIFEQQQEAQKNISEQQQEIEAALNHNTFNVSFPTKASREKS